MKNCSASLLIKETKVETEIPDRKKTMHGKEETRFTTDLGLREGGIGFRIRVLRAPTKQHTPGVP